LLRECAVGAPPVVVPHRATALLDRGREVTGLDSYVPGITAIVVVIVWESVVMTISCVPGVSGLSDATHP
jgi:hypothetical protein